MFLLIPSLVCCGWLCSLVSAGPSPQWLFEQIHALPATDNDQVTTELHTKKSDIPEHKRRKDGVKRLFHFLDSAIQESGNGSGESSAKEDITATGEHSGFTGLTDKQLDKDDGPKQQGAIKTNSTSVSPYVRSMQGDQNTAYGFPVTGQHQSLITHTASRTRPPAIPVRGQVTGNNLLTQQLGPAASSQGFAGGLYRSNIQTPYYFTTTIVGPNHYGSYFFNTQGIPVADGKSAEPLQEKAYSQPKRQREQFHQQTRGFIPGRIPVRSYSRYPYLPPPANFPGTRRAAIQPHFPYRHANTLASRARMPVSQYPMAPPNLSNQVYYRHLIPQRQANLAFTARMMRDHGYPLVTQKPAVHALINRKPQPRNLLTTIY